MKNKMIKLAFLFLLGVNGLSASLDGASCDCITSHKIASSCKPSKVLCRRIYELSALREDNLQIDDDSKIDSIFVTFHVNFKKIDESSFIGKYNPAVIVESISKMTQVEDAYIYFNFKNGEPSSEFLQASGLNGFDIKRYKRTDRYYWTVRIVGRRGQF